MVVVRILVIGYGFLGRAIVEALDSLGFEVTIFTRKISESPKLTFEKGDFFDYKSIKKTLNKDFDAVVSTAWTTTSPHYSNSDLNYAYAKATIELARIVSANQTPKLVILGSCAEYGKQAESIIAGTSIPKPDSIYGRQKLKTFREIATLLEKSQVKFNWARVFFPYGPGGQNTQFIAKSIESILRRVPISIVDSKSKRDWISTRDIASAIVWLLTNDVSREVDIGTSVGHSTLEVMKILEEVLDKQATVITNPREICDVDDLVVSSESPLFRAGWKPRDDLKTGLEWLVNS